MSKQATHAFFVAIALGADVTPNTHTYMGETTRGVMLFKDKLTGKYTKLAF